MKLCLLLPFIIRANAHADSAYCAPADVLVRFHMVGAFLCVEDLFSGMSRYVFLARDGVTGAGVAAESTSAAF